MLSGRWDFNGQHVLQCCDDSIHDCDSITFVCQNMPVSASCTNLSGADDSRRALQSMCQSSVYMLVINQITEWEFQYAGHHYRIHYVDDFGKISHGSAQHLLEKHSRLIAAVHYSAPCKSLIQSEGCLIVVFEYGICSKHVTRTRKTFWPQEIFSSLNQPLPIVDSQFAWALDLLISYIVRKLFLLRVATIWQ